MRDRLRATEVPLEAIDQLGGWSSVGGVGTPWRELEHGKVVHLDNHYFLMTLVLNG